MLTGFIVSVGVVVPLKIPPSIIAIPFFIHWYDILKPVAFVLKIAEDPVQINCATGS